jgi:hypothetical protein
LPGLEKHGVDAFFYLAGSSIVLPPSPLYAPFVLRLMLEIITCSAFHQPQNARQCQASSMLRNASDWFSVIAATITLEKRACHHYLPIT